jgi:ubiquinone/menaquinone biosynthesis C-methylase UbiE
MSSQKRDFNEKAAVWDENPARVKLAQDIARAINDAGILGPDLHVLDIGCGTGLLTLMLQPNVHHITAIDSAERMLAILDRKREHGQIGNVTTRRADLEAGTGIEGCFDLVVSSMTFHHIEDVPALLGRCATVLKAGGVLCIADLDKERGKFHEDNTGVLHQGFDRSILKKQFEAAGFCNVRNRTAAILQKPDPHGDLQCFTVFLMTGSVPDLAEANRGGSSVSCR